MSHQHKVQENQMGSDTPFGKILSKFRYICDPNPFLASKEGRKPQKVRQRSKEKFGHPFPLGCHALVLVRSTGQV